MVITDVWAPPNGSIELADEPGWWKTPNGSIYSEPAVLEQLTAERREASVAQARAEQVERQRQLPRVIDELVDRVQGLEMQAFLTEQFLEAATLMLAEADECEQFLEAVLAGVLSERTR